jgi:hypothetical protein
MIILRKEEEYEKAIEDAKKIIELDPSFPSMYKIMSELETL